MTLSWSRSGFAQPAGLAARKLRSLPAGFCQSAAPVPFWRLTHMRRFVTAM
jgi:hypothetical protein